MHDDHAPDAQEDAEALEGAAREHLRVREADAWVAALCKDEVAAVRGMLEEKPGRANQFVTQPVAWGQEMWMPLHFAADAGAAQVVAWLLDLRVRPDCRTRFDTPHHARQTPLHLAARRGYVPVIAALLDADADLEVLDARADRPLHLAARHGHAEAVNALVNAGAALDPRNAAGRTPLHEAIRSEEGVSDAAANAAALVLIDAGVDVNADCPNEPDAWSPLMRCEKLGERRSEVAETIRRHGGT